MSTVVNAGHTYAFMGVLDAGQTLTALSAGRGYDQGALIDVATTASNDGTIDLLAGPAHNGLQNATGAKLLITGALTNNGLIDLSGGGYGRPQAGPVTGAKLLDQGVLTNAGSIFIGAAAAGVQRNTTNGSGAILNDSGGLLNSGTISIAGGIGGSSAGSQGGTLLVSGYQLNNSGALIISGGMLAHGYGGAGGALRLQTTSYLGNSGQIAVEGGVGASGGTLIDLGLLSNTGTLAIDGGVDVREEEGFIDGQGGALQVRAGGAMENRGVLTFGTGGSYGGLGGYGQVAGLLTNAGTLNLKGSAGSYFSTALGASLEVTGTLTNQDRMIVAGGYGMSQEGSNEGYFGDGASLMVAGVLNNDGYLAVGAALAEGSAGILLDAGSLANTGTITLMGSGYGYHSPPPAATLEVTGSLANSGAINVGGGILNFFSATPGLGALLSVSGVLTNAGTVSVSGAAGKPFDSGAAGTVIDSGRLVNNGLIALVAGAYAGNAGALSVSAGATLGNSGTISGTGTLLNQGEIVARGGEITTAGLINDGTIQLAPATAFFISSAITDDAAKIGLLNLATGATLTLAGSIANTQAVAFIGTGETLALSDATTFAGVLDGLKPSATLDFLNLDVTSAATTGTSLMLAVSNGQTLDLTLGAPLPAGTILQLQSDNRGGTDLTLHQSSNAIGAGSGSYGLTGHEAFGAQTGSVGVLTVHLPL